MARTVVPIPQILRALAPVYANRGESVQIKHYSGTPADPDGFDEPFEVTALVGKDKVWAKDSSNKVKLQARVKRVVFRAFELPAGMTQGDLTDNDKIIYDGQEWDISAWDHVKGLASRASVEGG